MNLNELGKERACQNQLSGETNLFKFTMQVLLSIGNIMN